MVHYKKGENTVVCKARGGLRTRDLWQVTCKKCLEGLKEVLYLEELRIKRVNEDGA